MATKKTTKAKPAKSTKAKTTKPAKSTKAKVAKPTKSTKAKKSTVEQDNLVLKAFGWFIGNKRGTSTIFGEMKRRAKLQSAKFDLNPKDVQESVDRLVKAEKLRVYNKNYYEFAR